MLTTLLFIRHGQTDWNVAKKWQGHADIPLNETGLVQADALATRLQKWPIETIITSDLLRCSQTADVIGQKLDLNPVPDAIWRERDVGDFSGMTSVEAKANFPEVWAAANGKGMVDAPNGESFAEVRARGMRAYEKVIANHAGQMVAIVSHGGLLHTLIAQLIQIRDDVYGRISKRGNTGLSIVEVSDGVPKLVRLNDTSHLE